MFVYSIKLFNCSNTVKQFCESMCDITENIVEMVENLNSSIAQHLRRCDLSKKYFTNFSMLYGYFIQYMIRIFILKLFYLIS